ncbi:Glycosyltransferase involved in cell wall bisynthesis [Marininema mesophilum]|uniref:Glycosyltransferase involved in cell wall bisynthesis n=1 Tax=Marininema mesophilum TaxID=1048340 RepID=A0A1H2VLW6_9BACL|nr:glycosyltransferase family 4 protein [Marininema mesophilum]SDW69313.1 Glycosyltransferase involved in cell wall bisynthesis [Marininema mesophilum]
MYNNLPLPWIRPPLNNKPYSRMKLKRQPYMKATLLRKIVLPKKDLYQKELSLRAPSTRQKILFFTHMAKQGPLSGAEKTLLTMIQELSTRYDCYLIAPGASTLTITVQSLGCKVKFHPFRTFSLALSKRGFPEGALEHFHQRQPIPNLVQLIRSINPQLIVVSTAVNTVPVAAAHRTGIPVLWWIQEVIPVSQSLSKFLSFMSTHATAILGISKSTLAFQQHMTRRLPSYLLSPVSNDVAQKTPATWPRFRRHVRSSLGLTEKDLAVGFVSIRATQNKGYNHFMRLASLLPMNQLPIHLLVRSDIPDGTAGFRKRCSQLVKPHLLSRLHLLPTSSDLRLIYPALDLLIVPSLINEGFGLTTLEGMTFGIPVVAYRSGGLEEIFRATNNGRFLAPKGNVSALATKATILLQRPNLRAQVGLRNRLAIQRSFGIQLYRQRLFSIFNNLLSRRKG